MDRARDRDSSSVSDVIYDLIAAGPTPGPRSFHGLTVSQCLAGDVEGSVNFLLFLGSISCKKFEFFRILIVIFMQCAEFRCSH